MRLLFDLTPLQNKVFGQTNHGGGKYTKTVLNKLNETVSNKIFFVCNSNYFIEENIITKCKEKGHYVLEVKNKYEIINIIKKFKIDRFYSALSTDYHDLNLGEVQFYFTIHGPRQIELPFDKYEIKYSSDIQDVLRFYYKYFCTERYKKTIRNRYVQLFNVSKDVKYIVVSEHSKASMMNIFPEYDFSKTPVYYSPLYINTGDKLKYKSILSKYNLKRKSYFLMVSGNLWVKNCLRAAEAFDELISEIGINYKIVITGIGNKNIYGKLKNSKYFVLLDYIDDIYLEELYKNAYAFIYPSLNEGFGYPPLEAMKYGIPSAVSGTASIPEICGDAVLYFNSYNIQEIKIKIRQLTDNREIIPVERLSSRFEIIKKKQDKALVDLINWIIS